MRQDLAAAMRHYDAAIQLDPQSATARFRLGRALLRQQQHAEAVSHLEACVRLEPKRALFHDWLGVALAELGRWDAARRQFEEALRLEPNHAAAAAHLRQLDALKNGSTGSRGDASTPGAAR
jgi:Flp pilus assembly protein TadD